MRIALCLTGQPRALEEGFSYYQKNLLAHYNIDVFCHSWNTHLNDKILELYNPVDYKFENYKFSKKYDEIYAHCNVHHTSPPRYSLAQFYSVLQTRDMKSKYELENNFTYDWVIKARYDYALNFVINFEKLDTSKIHLPIRKYVHPDGTYDKGFCDLFGFGSSYYMNKYMSVYEFIDHFSSVPNFKFFGEHLLSSTLMLHGLRDRYNYPAGENEQVTFIDMNDPFIGYPEENGRKWVYSLIRSNQGDRNLWLTHEEDYWNSLK